LSSLSEHERLGLDDLFLSLGKKESFNEKLYEHKNRLISSLAQVAIKGLPKGISFVKSKKIMFLKGAKVSKFKLFHKIIPKNRASK